MGNSTRSSVKDMDIHPCHTCRLPDCDEKHKSCNLKLVLARYSAEKKRGRKPDEVLTKQNSIAYAELYAPRRDRSATKRREA